ncbi:hypothetical protein BM86_06970 [Bacillus thuringiensis]|nr:hypothetical protein [Bacillus thuringiensis]
MLSVTSIRNTRSEKPPLSSAFFFRMLLISSSVMPMRERFHKVTENRMNKVFADRNLIEEVILTVF